MSVMEHPYSIDAGSRDARAVVVGAAVTVGGSLVVTTVIGIAAITGMLIRGASPDRIAAELPGSLALTIFVTLGGLLMSAAGGYTAAAMAPNRRYWHALAASILAAGASIALLPVWGESPTDWLTAISLALIVPCGIVGAWLAMPMQVLTSAPQKR
jgi:hypothetical protein